MEVLPRGSTYIKISKKVCALVILTYYCYYSTRLGSFVVGDSALIVSYKSPSHHQCVVVGGCCCIGY